MPVSLVRVVWDFYPDRGGSIEHIRELSLHMQPYLSEQILVAPKFKGDYEDQDSQFSNPVVRVPYKRVRWGKLYLPFAVPLTIFSYARNVISYIKEVVDSGQRVDLIHVHGMELGQYITYLAKKNKLKIPVVLMLHGNPTERGIYVKLVLNSSLFLFTLVRPDYVLILDDGTQIDKIIQKVESKNIPCCVVNHGVDSNFFKPAEGEHLRREFVVLSTHRLLPVKRLDLAILAFKRFLQGLNHKETAKLKLIGDGPSSQELVKLAKDNGLTAYIDFLGEKTVREVRESLNSADVVVGTSLESNMNRAIQEAMACATPVVVFDSGGTNRLIKHMVNGILVEPGDVIDFARNLKLLLEDVELRKTLGANARATILQSRSWKARVTQELLVYREVLGDTCSAREPLPGPAKDDAA